VRQTIRAAASADDTARTRRQQGNIRIPANRGLLGGVARRCDCCVPRFLDQPGGGLAETVAQIPGFGGAGAVLTVSDDRLGVRLTRGVFRLEVGHLDLARVVSAAGRRHGGVADREAAKGVQLAVTA
jgi:hypothetical protein